MLTVDDYLDAARSNSALASDRAIARALETQAATVNHWRTKRTLPSDEFMVKLAALGGKDPTEALLHLNSWRSTGHAATLYLNLIKKVSAAAATFLITFGLLSATGFVTPAQAVPLSGNQALTIDYGKYMHGTARRSLT